MACCKHIIVVLDTARLKHSNVEELDFEGQGHNLMRLRVMIFCQFSSITVSTLILRVGEQRSGFKILMVSCNLNTCKPVKSKKTLKNVD